MEKELEKLLAKRDAMNLRHLARYSDGTATRARTTTHNADVGRLNERIDWLRSEIKKAAAA